jgi:predicted O-methyltransferase YrrM
MTNTESPFSCETEAHLGYIQTSIKGTQLMSQPNDNPLWTEVDQYLNETLIPANSEIAPILESALAANAAANLPTIDVSPTQGKFLHLLALLQGATRILEIGTLGGYSTIWLARALPPEGHLLTLEFEPKHAAVARENIARAGLAHLVEIQIGPAADSLAKLHAQSPQPFDLIFIDADKPNNPTYLEWALKLSRKGTLIIVDNVIRDGEIANPASTEPAITGTRTMFEMLGANQQGNARLTATALQTVGSKGYDGFALALVTSD